MFSFIKVFWKTNKNNSKRRKKINKSDPKQIQKIVFRHKSKINWPIASLFSKDFLTEEAKYELNKIVEMENKLNRNDLIYKTGSKKSIKHMIFKSLKEIFWEINL